LPIFIVGAPRSGTTVLFDLLVRSPDTTSLSGESHLLWETFHPEGGRGWRSHAVAPEDVTPRERRVLNWAIRQLGPGRYVDKSPRNSLRVAYVDALFPDARFVFLKRDGRAVVSSLLTGWRSGDRRFPALDMGRPLSIQGYDGAGWRFLVPPGWEEYATGRTLAEVCAFQWTAATGAILAGRELVGPDRWLEVAYEDLVASPRAEAERILRAVGLPVEDGVLAYADELPGRLSKVTVSEPRPGKWREENPDEVRSVFPLIEPLMTKLGYSVSDEPGA
jgi:hypothetical protein